MYHDLDLELVQTLEGCDEDGGAVDQLPKPARSVAMVALFGQHTFALTRNPAPLVSHLFGTICEQASGRYLPCDRFGKFMAGSWNHVAGVVLFDLARSSDIRWTTGGVQTIDTLTYPCTVLLNPKAERPANPDWFPRARVVVLEGDTFRWVRGEPRGIHRLRTGTRVVDQLPES